jgi:hypothetical protein
MKEIVITLITVGIPAIVALIALIVQKEKKIHKSNKANNNEIKFNHLFFSSKFLEIVHEKVNDIFKKTRADRFLILYAVNGKTNFNFVTVCYEMGVNNTIIGATKRYQKFQIDEPYRIMLKRAEFDKPVILDVKNMEDCFLKSVYQSSEEKIHHSIVKFITRISIDDNNDIIVYMSIATKSTDTFSKDELNNIKYNTDQIKIEANNIIID